MLKMDSSQFYYSPFWSFLADFLAFIGHVARYAPSSGKKIISKNPQKCELIKSLNEFIMLIRINAIQQHIFCWRSFHTVWPG